MAKIALLIGVSEYLPEFPALHSAVKDVEAMKEVLGNSAMGGFDEIKVLKNSNRQQIEKAIYELFDDRDRDDVLLFYFSGHGVLSRESHLLLTTPETYKGKREIVPYTVVTASYLQAQMNNSFSQRLVVILDCCYSGAFTKLKGITAKGDENIDIKAELGGKGRAILMSSSSTQSSFESKGSELSIYTKYLVEGIKTGAADTDGDGKISADELHQYVSGKVHKESPAMTPQFAPVLEGYRIYLACSPKSNYPGGEQETLPINDDRKIDLSSYIPLKESLQKTELSEQESDTEENKRRKSFNPPSKLLVAYLTVIVVLVTILYPLLLNLELSSTSGLKLVTLIGQNSRYFTLENLLKQEKWKEADKETLKMVKIVAGKGDDGLDVNSIKNFPCPDLNEINQLWENNSDKKFGFVVQKEIYQDLGGTERNDEKILKEFEEKVGWRRGDKELNFNELTFDLDMAYKGHLPFAVVSPGVTGLFFSRVETCEL